MRTQVLLERLNRIAEIIDFGSGGMMRQSRVLASLARTDDPAKVEAGWRAGMRVARRLQSAVDRSYNAPLIGGIEEKLRLTRVNRERISRYQARMGMR